MRKTRMQIGRRTKPLMMMSRPAGTHWPFNGKPPCRRAPRHTAMKRTLRIRTQRVDATYKLHPPKGNGSPAGARHSLLFVKGKGKGKGEGKGKGKGKQGKGKGHRKGKEGKGKELMLEHSRTRA